MAFRPEFPQVIQRHLAKELRKNTPGIKLFQLKSKDLLEIHFSLAGPKDTIYAQGVYHGKILLDMAHPYKPPNVQMITPSGRFETGKNICFSYTSYHPEHWSPMITFSDIIIGIMSLFDAKQEMGIGIIKEVDEAVVAKYAEGSRTFSCDACGANHSEMQL